MPAEWAVNAMALLGGAARGYAEGAQQRFGNQMAVRGQALQERQQMAGEKASQDQENRLRVQLRHDIETAEREMQFKYVQLDATKQMALMDQTLRYEQNQQGWQGLAIDREKLHVLTDMEMYKFNNVPASQWAEQAARKGYIDQQGGIDRILQSAGFTHDEKMGFASYVYGSKLAKEAVDNAIRQAGGVAGATYPFESGARRETAALQPWVAGETAAATYPFEARLEEVRGREQRRGIMMTGHETRLTQKQQPGLAEEQARRLYPVEVSARRNEAQWGLQGKQYDADIANNAMANEAYYQNQLNEQTAGREMAQNPEVPSAYGDFYGQRMVAFYQQFRNQQYPDSEAHRRAEIQVWSEISNTPMSPAAKQMIWQRATQVRAKARGIGGQAGPQTNPQAYYGNPQGQPSGQRGVIPPKPMSRMGFQDFLLRQSYGPYRERKLGPQW